MDDGSPRISHQVPQILDEISTIHCKSLAKQAHSLVLKFPHHLSYFYVQPASSVFIFPASSPACFTGAGLDTQGVRQITRPVLQKKQKKNQEKSQESQPGTVQINTSVLWKTVGVGFGGRWGIGSRGTRKGAEFNECV